MSEKILNNKRNTGNLFIFFFPIVSVFDSLSFNSNSQPGYLNKKYIRLGYFLYSSFISFLQSGSFIKNISSNIIFLIFSGIILVILNSGIIKEFSNSSENFSSSDKSALSSGIKSIISLMLFSFSSVHNKHLNKSLINSKKFL